MRIKQNQHIQALKQRAVEICFAEEAKETKDSISGGFLKQKFRPIPGLAFSFEFTEAKTEVNNEKFAIGTPLRRTDEQKLTNFSKTSQEIQRRKKLVSAHIQNTIYVDSLGRQLTPFATFGDFCDYCAHKGKFITFDQLKSIIGQIFRGLAVFHQENVAHRDLKLGNFLIFPGPNGELLIKISDLATLTEVDPATGCSKTYHYMDAAYSSPEVVLAMYQGLDNANINLSAADIYSCARVFEDLLSHHTQLTNDQKKLAQQFVAQLKRGTHEARDELGRLRLKKSFSSELRRDLTTREQLDKIAPENQGSSTTKFKIEEVFTHPFFEIAGKETPQDFFEKLKRFDHVVKINDVPVDPYPQIDDPSNIIPPEIKAILAKLDTIDENTPNLAMIAQLKEIKRMIVDALGNNNLAAFNQKLRALKEDLDADLAEQLNLIPAISAIRESLNAIDENARLLIQILNLKKIRPKIEAALKDNALQLVREDLKAFKVGLDDDLAEQLNLIPVEIRGIINNLDAAEENPTDLVDQLTAINQMIVGVLKNDKLKVFHADLKVVQAELQVNLAKQLALHLLALKEKVRLVVQGNSKTLAIQLQSGAAPGLLGLEVKGLVADQKNSKSNQTISKTDLDKHVTSYLGGLEQLPVTDQLFSNYNTLVTDMSKHIAPTNSPTVRKALRTVLQRVNTYIETVAFGESTRDAVNPELREKFMELHEKAGTDVLRLLSPEDLVNAAKEAVKQFIRVNNLSVSNKFGNSPASRFVQENKDVERLQNNFTTYDKICFFIPVARHGQEGLERAAALYDELKGLLPTQNQPGKRREALENIFNRLNDHLDYGDGRWADHSFKSLLLKELHKITSLSLNLWSEKLTPQAKPIKAQVAATVSHIVHRT